MDNDDNKRSKPFVDINRVAPSPPESTDDLLRPWLRLAGQLVPLIGETGFCALFVRAARLAEGGNGGLTPAQACRTANQLFAGLAVNLASLDRSAASAANTALLNTFTKLLSALIGEALTTRLLSASNEKNDGPESAQEHK
jgi:hypothetical protein